MGEPDPAIAFVPGHPDRPDHPIGVDEGGIRAANYDSNRVIWRTPEHVALAPTAPTPVISSVMEGLLVYRVEPQYPCLANSG